jgi:pyrimidine-nucleoside phosphorylase
VNPIEMIEAKKRGYPHADVDLRWWVEGITDESIPDYQVASWLMAVWQRGLDTEETFVLTEAMRDSGDRLDLSSLEGLTADKHSTGGVGDKISLPLAPLAACLGLKVPMLSGRGLGHTGGTLDKLLSIPGYRVDLSPDEMVEVVRDVGCSIIGQTPRIAPADRRLYSLRDVTGTVDCIPLIVSSILSKKFAAGPEHLVIDLKCGSGAFMQDIDEAQALATALIAVGRRAGKKISAWITNMDEPLGDAVGHAMEVRESLDVLAGQGPSEVRDLTLALVAEMGELAEVGQGESLRAALVEHLDSGRAMEKFLAMVAAQGGRLDASSPSTSLVVAPESAPLCADREGVLARVDTKQVGLAAVDLGGGRLQHTDAIDYSVGLEYAARVGDRVEKGQPLFGVYASDEDRASAARQRLLAAIDISEDAIERQPLLLRHCTD